MSPLTFNIKRFFFYSDSSFDMYGIAFNIVWPSHMRKQTQQYTRQYRIYGQDNLAKPI